ncbi:MAG: hypothetical protein ACJAT2_001332 [Bacteriovoracaceae bacterium]
MRAFFILIFLSLSASLFGADFDCESEFLKEAKELLASDHQGLLEKQFELTTLKLSKKALTKNKTNLEALIREFGRGVDQGDPRVLTQLENLYQKYGRRDDNQKILENFKTASYWNGQTRFYNEDTSMFILAKINLDPNESELNNKDAAITWFAQNLSDQIGSKDSRRSNLINISSHVASITGAISGVKKLGLQEVNLKIKSLKDIIKKGFSALKDDLSLSFKKNCFKENGDLLICRSEEDLFSDSIFSLSKDLGDDKLYEFSLENEVSNKFRGKISFKVRTNLEHYAKQKLRRPRSPKLPILFAGMEDYQEKKKWQDELNQFEDEDLIKAYQQKIGRANYGILDKANSVLSLYSAKGHLLATVGVKLSKSHFDSKKTSGSGIYEAKSISDSLQIEDQRGFPSKLSLSSNSLDCGEKESCQGGGSPSRLIEKYLLPNGKLYILPYDGENHFLVKNSELQHTTTRRSHFYEYNYSPKGNKAFPIEIEIKDSRYDTEVSREFVNALESEKATIMKLYNLDNDEYNDLARYAFGILGNESEFGENWRYSVKERFPLGVAFIKETKKNVINKTKEAYQKAKGFWSGLKAGATTYFKELVSRDVRLLTGNLTAENNSRGPTQIKTVPSKIEEHYKITKDNISEPKNAAIATMGFLAEAMVELKNRAKTYPAITRENRLDYLHYIYMGSTHEIKNQTATPDKNIYLRQLKEYLKGVKLYQRVTL